MTYKLIKKYPGSPMLGTVLVMKCNGWYESESSNQYPHSPEVIENNPEFWEEVIKYPIGTKVVDTWTNSIYEKNNGHWIISNSSPKYTINESEIGEGKRFELVEEPKKSYEILSFQAAVDIRCINGIGFINKGRVVHRIKYGNFKNIEVYPNISSEEQLLLNNPNWKIHSVRRLSDNEILTIGDKTNHGTIKEFEVCKDNRILLSFSERFCLPCYLDAKGSLPKKLKVLFTTEDGVDIREGDEYYYIKDMKVCKSQAMNMNYGKIKNFYFSTREKAEEYILLNKPCLSIEDIKKTGSIGESFGNIGAYLNIKELEKLVKSRL